MNPKNTLVTAAFSLIMSAIATEASDIQITRVPYFISVPGTYVFASDLFVAAGGDVDILVQSSVAGPIIIDFKGRKLSLSNALGGILIYNPTGSRITIRNGTIQGPTTGIASEGVIANLNVGELVPRTNISDLHIEKMTFSNLDVGILLNQVNSSSVTDCIFTSSLRSSMVGIRDVASQGGNLYRNDSFDGNEAQQLVVLGATTLPYAAGPVVLEECRYKAPVTAECRYKAPVAETP